jgi:hypothetical protein
MPDFQVWDQTAHPIVRLENDWNKLLAHGLVVAPDVIVRINGSYYEALDGNDGTISYGGEDNAGSTDGTDPDAVIQAAITNENYTFIQSGTYSGLDTLQLDTLKTVKGAGPGKTILNFDLAAAENAFEFITEAQVNKYVRFGGMSIVDTNKATTGCGIYAPNTSRCIWEDVAIEDFYAGNGVNMHATAAAGNYWNNWFNVFVDDALIGFLLDATANRNNANNFTQCRANSPNVAGSTGVKIDNSDGQANRFNSCDFSNQTLAMDIRDAFNNGSNIWIDTCTTGIDVSTTTNNWWENIWFNNNVTTPVDWSGGSLNRFPNCFNYVESNQNPAVIANGTASIQVAHGLTNGATGLTPTHMQCSGTHTEVDLVYISAYDDTNLTITTADGNTSADRQVYWMAQFLT